MEGVGLDRFPSSGWARWLTRAAAPPTATTNYYRSIWISDLHLGTPRCKAEALYDFLGEELSETARSRMEAWRRSKPLEGQTYARTDPAVFGLNRADLRERFRFYSERFGVVPAAAAT